MVTSTFLVADLAKTQSIKGSTRKVVVPFCERYITCAAHVMILNMFKELYMVVGS